MGVLANQLTSNKNKVTHYNASNLCPDSNHPHMIDLGLPSGTLWSCCNLGAESPENNGKHYAWGETTPKIDKYKLYNMDNNGRLTIFKYNTKASYGQVDNLTQLELADDAVSRALGNSWRMPTYDDFEELINGTKGSWAECNGIKGRKFTSKVNGNTIFFPAAGRAIFDKGTVTIYSQGVIGDYWSSSLDKVRPSDAYHIYYDSYSNRAFNWSRAHRENGLSVRPVFKK